MTVQACVQILGEKKWKDNEWHFPLLYGSLIQRDIYTGKQCIAQRWLPYSDW